MAATVQFHDDTIREMARWTAKKYGLGPVDVFFRSRIEDSKGWAAYDGLTHGRPGTRGPFYIELSQKRFYGQIADTLIHELAHCIATKNLRYCGHGPKFKRIKNELIAAWNSHARERGAV